MLSRGVSTIIAAIFIIMVFMLIFIYLAYTMRDFEDLASEYVEVVNEVAMREKESLRVTYVTANNTGIYLGLRNEGTITSIIKGYSVRDLSNNHVWYGTFANPYAIPPGGGIDMHISGNYSQDAAYLITLVTEVGNIVRTKYPHPVTNVTRAYLLKQQLQTITGEGTVTWADQAVIPILKNITSNITYAEVNGQSISDLSRLEKADYNAINIVGTKEESIVLINNNTLLYDDYLTNPINNKAVGNFSYDEEEQAIYVHHSMYSEIEGANKEDSQYIISSIYYNRNISLDQGRIYILYHFRINDTLKVSAKAHGAAHAYTQGALIYAYNRSDRFISGLYIRSYTNNTSSITDYRFFLNSTFTGITNNSTIPLINTSGNTMYAVITLWEYPGQHKAELYNLSVPNITYASVEIRDESTNNGYVGFEVYSNVSVNTLEGGGKVQVLKDIYWYFDNLVVSKANPRFLNITNIPSDWYVVLNASSPNVSLDSRYNATRYGNTLTFDILSWPILRNVIIIVYDGSGNPHGETSFPVVVGGNVYAYMPYYVNVSIISKSNVNVGKLYVCVCFTANTSVNATVELYNFHTSKYDTILDISNINSIEKCIDVQSYSPYINSTNNTIIKLLIYSYSPFKVSIDVLNTNVTTYTPEVMDALIVGVGGTSRVDVYELGFNGVDISLRYVKSLDVHSLFDGSTDITYDSNVTMSLMVVNDSGVYSVSLYSGKFSVINDSSPYFPSPGLVSVRAEVLDGKLLVVRGFTNGNDYLLIDLSNGNIVENGSLGVNISCTKYCVSASDGSNAYLLVLNASIGKPVIMRYSLGSGWEVLTNFTGYKSTGMCFGNGYLYVMLEMGGLYRVSVIDGSYELLNVNLPFYPRGFGDRLEYYAGNLIFVRDDDTTEVWVISSVE